MSYRKKTRLAYVRSTMEDKIISTKTISLAYVHCYHDLLHYLF